MIKTGDNIADVRRTNRSTILKLLHESEGLSRKRLSEIMGLTPAAITKIVSELIQEGLVTEGGTVALKRQGRREVLLRLNGKARIALGIFLNREEAILSANYLNGDVLFSEYVAIPKAAPAVKTVQRLSRRVLELAKMQNLPLDRIIGVGVAIRGTTDRDARVSVNNLAALDQNNLPVADLVEAETGYPAVIANTIRAIFAAQMYLRREPEQDSEFFLRCDYGIGAALSADGRIWYGAHGQCSEIGHIQVIRRGGKPCTCGKSGCLETIASPTAIAEDALSLLSPEKTPVLWQLVGDRKPKKLPLQMVLDAARGGDSAIAEVVDKAVQALGYTLKAVIYTVDPKKIVLYGRIFEDSCFLSKLIADVNEGIESSREILIEKSPYNGQLEDKAAGLVMVSHFLERGGMA